MDKVDFFCWFVNQPSLFVKFEKDKQINKINYILQMMSSNCGDVSRLGDAEFRDRSWQTFHSISKLGLDADPTVRDRFYQCFVERNFNAEQEKQPPVSKTKLTENHSKRLLDLLQKDCGGLPKMSFQEFSDRGKATFDALNVLQSDNNGFFPGAFPEHFQRCFIRKEWA